MDSEWNSCKLATVWCFLNHGAWQLHVIMSTSGSIIGPSSRIMPRIRQRQVSHGGKVTPLFPLP